MVEHSIHAVVTLRYHRGSPASAINRVSRGELRLTAASSDLSLAVAAVAKAICDPIDVWGVVNKEFQTDEEGGREP